MYKYGLPCESEQNLNKPKVRHDPRTELANQTSRARTSYASRPYHSTVDTSMSSSSTSPSAQDIWKWTFTKEATAHCFIRDVLSMKESTVKGPFKHPIPTRTNHLADTDFYWLGYVPCRTVLIVGIVVGIQEYEKRTLYTSKCSVFRVSARY